MKKVFLLIVGVASFATMQAQTKFGVKAGANFASLTGDAEDVKMKVGFNAGAFARFSLGESFSLQPELVFSAQGAKEDGGDAKINLSYVNIPILAQYHFKGGFNVEAGPQIGFLTTAKLKEDGNKVDIKDGLKSTDFSLAFGAAYTTAANIGFNARYNLGLGNISDGGGKIHNSVIQVGVFYVLSGGDKK